MLKVMSIIGTRPEAIKMAPIVIELGSHPNQIQSTLCVTGQHREMLDATLEIFSLQPDFDLDVMRSAQSLTRLTSVILESVSRLLAEQQPDAVLVQGDTTTVLAASLAAFYNNIAVGHVEAGLRSGNMRSPFPEELNRRVAAVLSSYHFAPTPLARSKLLAEGVPADQIVVTGNPVIDSLHWLAKRPDKANRAASELVEQAIKITSKTDHRLVLVTAHRRENHGAPLKDICRGLLTLVERNPNLVVVYPVHLNPRVQEVVYDILSGRERIFLTPPLEYDGLALLIQRCHFVLTDSGGIQEEAPAFGKPVLVLRQETEREEAITAGVARLIGTNAETIVRESEKLLHEEDSYRAMSKTISPYGDGLASKRVVDTLLGKPVMEFQS